MLVVIAILMVILAIVQGCGKEKIADEEEVFDDFSTEIVESEVEEVEVVEVLEDKIEIAKIDEMKEYEIQVFASQKASDLDGIRSELQKLGFKTKIVGKVIDGKNWYRLRLADIFGISEAKKVSNEIESAINSIDGVWIHKVL